MTFHVGQKVVCVGAREQGGWMSRAGKRNLDVRHPVEGAVYVIRFIDQHCGVTYLHFDEFAPRSYDAQYFRPVVDTDISCFTALLNPSPAKETERV